MSFHILIFVRLNTKMKSMIDTTAKIAPNAQIGKGTIIEEFTVIAPNAIIGDECKIHRNIFSRPLKSIFQRNVSLTERFADFF